ncbi:MAG: DUF4127 family protein [Acidobacteria bacterium]|nr:DUF4127 family protein [Acidobacteriota bacterium]
MIRVGRKRLFCVALLICVVHLLAAISSSAQTKLTSRILLIPLDDRPPCLQMPVKMGLIGDAEVVVPPRAMLGRFTEFGRSDEIVEWIKKQKLTSFDAAIVSIDMIAYGGLVAMREFETTSETALKRLEVIRAIRKAAPKMPIYGSSVIMRLAPTGNVVNESYRVNLARWAEISPDPAKAQETAELEEKIPAEALAKYKKARERDLRINLHTVDLVREGVIDYLILSQDDAKPNGVHIADRETLIAKVAQLKLQEKIAIQPGADEVSMLLLSRALTAKYKYQPKIKAIFSDEKLADQFMPYEDRPLRKTVSFHIKAAGGVEVADEKDAAILFFVFVSRFENGAANRFAQRINDEISTPNGDGVSFPRAGANQLIVADVDPKGEIQGADIEFTKSLLRRSIFSRVLGYASWNTAGNTIGTAVPHGIISGASKFLINRAIGKGVRAADAQRLNAFRLRTVRGHTWFMVNRLLDDHAYHSIVRPKAIEFARSQGWNVFRFESEQTTAVERYSVREMAGYVRTSLDPVAVNDTWVACPDISKFSFRLPWGRTFEAELDFELTCKLLIPIIPGTRRVKSL